jgi:hypothetical protein
VERREEKEGGPVVDVACPLSFFFFFITLEPKVE